MPRSRFLVLFFLLLPVILCFGIMQFKELRFGVLFYHSVLQILLEDSLSIWSVTIRVHN